MALVDFDDPAFIDLLHGRTDDITVGRPSAPVDLLFYGAATPTDLQRLAGLEPAIKRNGAVWVIREKGKGAALKDTDIIDAGKAARFVDNKIASFSDTQSAMRLVIPLSRR